MDCTICKKPIVLVPSAEERAKKFGGTPAFYTRLFTEHAACVLTRRATETSELIYRSGRRNRKGEIMQRRLT